ncbi:hypothetical protein [Streptomyces sp. SP18BB07]|uniref:hypothetical protein n=1 Tax=Streptomyces sp. SP18BB07 TaxID=3002522 RepID=UPI002E75A216|nr:hypothetical protein [Streptomyces sp. SP18BB07]MEE1763675.1 hypothetical protein [Streptomyces sp. SP18BB07]
MILADDANDVTRETFSSVVDPDILRFAMVKNDRDMRKILARLVEEKVLERVSGGGNGRVAKYRFRYLTPADSPNVAGPEETAKGIPGLVVAGPESTSNSEVAGSDETANSVPGSGAMSQKEPATEGVGGSFSHRSRSKKNLPTPSTSSTTSSTTAAPDESVAVEGSKIEALFDEPTPGPPAAARRQKKPSERKPNPHQVADDLTAAYWERHGKGRAQSFISIRGVVRTAIGNGFDRDDCARALDRCARTGRAISGASLDIALGEIRRDGQRTTAPPTAPRHMTEEEKRDALQF